MTNTREIQPKQIWTNLGEKNATHLALTNFFNYHFDNGGGTIVYKFFGMEGNPESAYDYFIGELNIPSEIIQQWGESDDIIFNYVAEQLNIVFVEQ